MRIKVNIFLFSMIALSAQAEELALDYSGDIRVGVQYNDSSDTGSGTDLALGGNLHVQTKPLSGISVGVTLHTSNALLNQNDAYGVPFYDINSKSYAILSEAYIQGNYENSSFILGRQTLDTPFLDSDDIGMVPNTFEAYTLMNQDIKDISIIYSYVRSMSGVDAAFPEKFSDINGGSGMHLIGLNYEAIENVALSGWFYHIPHYAKLSYLDAGYEEDFKGFNYALGAQFALQDFREGERAKIFGLSASVTQKKSALTLDIAYNKAMDGAAINGFGGGPFFVNVAHMTLAEVGKDGEVFVYGAEWDASEVLMEGLSLGVKQAQLKDAMHNRGDETDLLLSFAASETLTFDAVYSTLDNSKISGDTFEIVRAFVNYSF